MQNYLNRWLGHFGVGFDQPRQFEWGRVLTSCHYCEGIDKADLRTVILRRCVANGFSSDHRVRGYKAEWLCGKLGNLELLVEQGWLVTDLGGGLGGYGCVLERFRSAGGLIICDW